ncbi:MULTISPECIES: carbohydrate binding domain-containing protein [Streptomyces]|uniref:Secreted alpha-amylase n=1 Tax=Streptomyces venezuelae (strain ATCC 10712 / CBS 650.69 / DSM 40230 / JCM 4526 / NBRC 13096 / PD 04745) TaxID=953739 RepID=F2RKC9_STRVP|nr:carbohydrate binding domain-containing protein [Streptomyces venezuelae]APE25630.1 alpha-amylase [Streptomyces venezuelae]CCA60285.1 secreted alpha-amylase [Streptomyces venezuelae ATCC 10712]
MTRTPLRPPGRAVAVLAVTAGLLGLLTARPDAPAPAPRTAPVAATAENTATVFYWTKTKNWARYNLHWAPDGGSWTTVPGVAMEAACTDWVKKTVSLGTAAGLQATFTNGSGTWDNNGGRNYALGTGSLTVKDGVIAHSDPCAGTGPEPTPTPGAKATVYYSTAALGWSTANLHYQPAGGAWTTVPGVGMQAACAGWWKREVDLGTATSLRAAFNNGNGTWDNNGGADYTIGAGVSTVRNNAVTANAADPCAAEVPDTQAPTVPAKVTAAADGVSVLLTWDPATDNKAVAKYQVTRVGGSGGTVVTDVGSTVFSDTGLAERTAYTYTVKAVDAAGNVSAASAPAAVTTGDKPATPATGRPLGTDPRKDPVYFVLTARFNDGDPSNNRGGSQHVKSGNAANDDPMFRGDFKGLIQKLDYVKGLGFSAIWVTPVVLNRSDYDYHGYHGYDFYKVDPRLESAGASYQDLIDAAHAKGMKIYQDVVYNHSSRWGAKGLFTPTVYGVRDSQWSWYYDEKQPGFTYDGLTVDPKTGKSYYNGDLWSTAEPAGNTCLNWGKPTGGKSPEGYTLYNCQWPSPTSGMFPKALYHNCWLGNWEGEDSRSCWLHDDLADFNTESAAVQNYLIGAYDKYIDMGVDGFRVDTAVHVPRTTWNRRFLPAIQERVTQKFGAEAAKNFLVFGEVGAFVNDKWNRGSVNHSAQFFTWKERKEYDADDAKAAVEMYDYENQAGTAAQPTSTNAFLDGNAYHQPDHSKFSGMNIIDMRMHMNFGDAANAFHNGKDSDDTTNDATYNVVYVDSHDYGPNKSAERYAGGTDAWAENMSLMWTFRGIPTLYYGSEIEFQKGKKIDCGPTCPLATTGRAYFGDHLAGSVTASDFSQVSAASGAVATTLEQPLVKHVQRLNQIRRAVPALQMGQYSTEGISGGMAFKRRYTSGGTDSFALVTVTGGATYTGIPNGTYTDAVTGDVRTVTGGTLTVAAPGKGNLRVYVLNGPGRIGTAGPYLK